MIAKSFIAAAAVATTMAVALPATEAQAKTNIDINVGLGFGGYYGGGYGHHHRNRHISCWKGRKIVDWSGFHNVHAVDCHLPGYKYTAWKHGHKYLVKVNRYGRIIYVHRIA